MTTPRRRTLVWFRGKDLRVADHGPLASALDAGEVIPLFVLDPNGDYVRRWLPELAGLAAEHVHAPWQAPRAALAAAASCSVRRTRTRSASTPSRARVFWRSPRAFLGRKAEGAGSASRA
jgi:hypothetical protein